MLLVGLRRRRGGWRAPVHTRASPPPRGGGARSSRRPARVRQRRQVDVLLVRVGEDCVGLAELLESLACARLAVLVGVHLLAQLVVRLLETGVRLLPRHTQQLKVVCRREYLRSTTGCVRTRGWGAF